MFLVLASIKISSARYYEHGQISVEEDATTDDQGERLHTYAAEGAGEQGVTRYAER